MSFATGLSKTKADHNAILVFADRLTKYGHTSTKCTAKTWVDLLIQRVLCNLGGSLGSHFRQSSRIC